MPYKTWWKPCFPMDYRPLVKGYIANLGISLDIFEFFCSGLLFPFKFFLGFCVFLVHPTVISVLLSASVERFDVSRMRDFKNIIFFMTKYLNSNRLGVINNHAQRDRQTDPQKDIATTRLNWPWAWLSENPAYGRHLISQCHLSTVTCHLTTTLCIFSCYESPRKKIERGRQGLKPLAEHSLQCIRVQGS